MSYIRAGSNPEALYIYDTRYQGKLNTDICYGDRIFTLPAPIFRGLMRRWLRNHRPDKIQHRFSVLRTIEEGASQHLFKMALSYPGWDKEIIAYETTWFYIASSVMRYY